MIDSDSRFRFERGVDPESVLSGIESATQMIIDICGGEASEIVLAGKSDFVKKTINDPETIKQDKEREHNDLIKLFGFQNAPPMNLNDVISVFQELDKLDKLYENDDENNENEENII